MVTIVLCCAVFGASLGIHRGGVQILYAAMKLPLVALLTAALCTPILSAMRRATTGATIVRRDFALVLSRLALGSLVLAALAPLVLLAETWETNYNWLILLTVACCLVAGAFGLHFLATGLGEIAWGPRLAVGTTLLLAVVLVGAQMTWTLRPYVLRPRSPDVPFVRSLEGGLIDAVSRSAASSQGIYVRDEAPLRSEWVQ